MHHWIYNCFCIDGWQGLQSPSGLVGMTLKEYTSFMSKNSNSETMPLWKKPVGQIKHFQQLLMTDLLFSLMENGDSFY